MSKSSPICHSHLQHHHRILNHHQHSNNITVIDIVTITIVYSVFTIAFSSLSFVEGSCRKQEEKLLWIVWTDPDPNDPNDTNVQCTIYNLQFTITIYNLQFKFTINGLSGQIPNLMILMILMIPPPLMQIQLRKILPNKIHNS